MSLRMKVVEEGDGYKILLFPFWANEKLIASAMESIRKDAAVRGRELKITIGHKLVKVEG